MQNNQKGAKRAAVDKNQTKIFIIVAVASVVVIATIVTAKGLWSQSSYLSKVTEKKEVAVKQLEANKVAVESLTEAYNRFDEQSPNLLGGSPDGGSTRDGSNSTLILDALPNRYDFPALTASLEKLLTSYTIEGISGNDDLLAQQGMPAGTPVEIPFSFSVNTSYDGFRQLLDTFNKSIRPFNLTKIELIGVNSDLHISAEAKTFYQPDAGVEIKKEIVQ